MNYINLGSDQTSSYYTQNYYNQQYYPQQYVTENHNNTASNLQYLQNYSPLYNYGQGYAQSYTSQNYGNYGYDTQGYSLQTYTQQLQQQLQPSTIQSNVHSQTNTQTQQQIQTVLPNIGGVSMNTSQPLIQIPQQTERKQENDIIRPMLLENIVSKNSNPINEKDSSKLTEFLVI